MARTHLLLGLKLDFCVHTKGSKETKMEGCLIHVNEQSPTTVPILLWPEMPDASVRPCVNEIASTGTAYFGFLPVGVAVILSEAFYQIWGIRILLSKIIT